MNARNTAGRLLVGLASLSLLGGCASGASPTPLPASSAPTSMPSAAVVSPTPTTTPTATTAPTSTPLSYGPVTVVTGTATCPTADVGKATTDPDGVGHYRDGTFRCTMRTDDPRVSGTHTTGTWNADWWGEANLSSGVQWATVRLENAGGAWEGQLSGVYSSPDRGDTIVIWYKGTGGYAGLSYFELWTGQEPWRIQGQIFPGDPPTPYSYGTPIARPETGGPVAAAPVIVVTGTATCTMDLNPTTDPEGVHHVRDGTVVCTDTTDDPRVSGTHTEASNFDGWGTAEDNFALVQWGTARLENDGGAWEGQLSGVASVPGRGDIIVYWYKGTGGYAGLSYFELWTGREPWKIQGQILPGDPPAP